MEQGGWNLYSYIYNSPTISNDIIGLYTVSYEVNLGVIGAPFYAKIGDLPFFFLTSGFQGSLLYPQNPFVITNAFTKKQSTNICFVNADPK